jgi:signal transduction histidine kinase
MTWPAVERRHADTRMRRLVPRFAVLACACFAIAGAASGKSADLLTLLLLVVIAVAVTGLVLVTGVLDRAPAWVIFLLMLAYTALIATPVGTAPATYELQQVFQLLPVFFGTFFFGVPVRYALAIAVALVAYATETTAPHAPSGYVLLAYLIGYPAFAYCASALSSILRDTLADNRALHAVLAATSADPGSVEALARQGLDAALTVLGREVGAVELRAGGVAPPVVAWSGVDEPAMREVAGSITRTFVYDGKPCSLTDIAETYPADHPLRQAGVRSLTVVPMRYRGEVIGALLAGGPGSRKADELESARMAGVADQLALALGAAMLFRREQDVGGQLRELNRRKDEFLATVSHELRTPATAIQLISHTLRQNWSRLTDEQIRSAFDSVNRQAVHLSNLIESLLAEAAAQAGGVRLALSDVDWSEALPRWADLVREQTGRRVDVQLPEGRVVSAADPAKMERVVSNLLINAVKFSSPASTVHLALAEVAETVRISVRDSGLGIPQDRLDRIFDAFYQLDSSTTRTAGGFGIGLSLVRHFVDAHGGSVEVESKVGEGSTFTVVLPRHPPLPPPRDSEPVEVSGAAAAGRPAR